MAAGAHSVLDRNTLRQILESRAPRNELGIEGHTYRSGVDGHTVVLVVHVGAGNDNVSAIPDVKPISIRSTRVVPGLVVNRHIGNSQTISAIDTNRLDGGVLDIQRVNGRRDKIMGIEEFWLRLAAVATLPVPPIGAVAIEIGATCASNGDAGAFDLEQRAVPFFVTPSRLAFEDHLMVKFS